MNYDFFHQTLKERRAYDYTDSHLEFIKREIKRMCVAYPEVEFFAPQPGPIGNWSRPSAVVSNLAAPPREGLAELQDYLDAELPEDFKAFYEQHNEAFFLGRNAILIMNPGEMIELSRNLRDAQEVSDEVPRHVLRFGSLDTESYFLIRYNSRTKVWGVFFSSYSHRTDEELLEENMDKWVIDISFSAWLRRMVATDGSPTASDYPDSDVIAVERIELQS